MSITLQEIRERDRDDALSAMRENFELPDGVIYLDGNSLGPLPKGVSAHAEQLIAKQWGQDLIGSWNAHDWINLPTKVGEKIAPLIGAAAGQTICCDSISVNLFKLLAMALEVQSTRSVVVSQTDNFPTDLYMVEGMQRLLGSDRCELRLVSESEVVNSLDNNVAVVMLTQVNFRSGKLHDIEAITRRAHQVGALVIWDLAHSTGVVPLQLDHWGVDFAVGCGYKFLNGGPGAPAFVYVNQKHLSHAQQPLAGWMGHQRPFDFTPYYKPAVDVNRLLSGTPPVISMSILDCALEVWQGVDLSMVRDKSLELTELMLQLVGSKDSLNELECITPKEGKLRGSQVAFRHQHGYAIAQCLIEAGVVIDFRSPDILRFGVNPLYTRFEDIWAATNKLQQVVESEQYRDPKYQHRAQVT